MFIQKVTNQKLLQRMQIRNAKRLMPKTNFPKLFVPHKGDLLHTKPTKMLHSKTLLRQTNQKSKNTCRANLRSTVQHG